MSDIWVVDSIYTSAQNGCSIEIEIERFEFDSSEAGIGLLAELTLG